MRVYIANLGKYNEGELVGDWFSFPIDEEDVSERIGLNSYYEEYAVHDTDNFPIEIGEYISIQELNEMYDMICELPDYITDALDEFVSYYGSLEEVYEHKDEIYYYPDCGDMTDVAYYFIDELQVLGQIPLPLQNYIDYEAYGRDLADQRKARSLLTAFFIKDSLKNGCPFPLQRKELKRIEED